eukprot:403372962
MDVDLEQQNTNRSDNNAKQSNIYFQETYASGLELKGLINQEGDYIKVKQSLVCQALEKKLSYAKYATMTQKNPVLLIVLPVQQLTVIIRSVITACWDILKKRLRNTYKQMQLLQNVHLILVGSHYSSAEEGLNFKEAYKQLESTLFERFKIHNKDFKYCPAKDCVYGGFKDKKYCTDNFVCEKCAYTWRDLSTMSNCDKLKITCKQTRYCHQYLLSQMHHLFFEKTCPNCGIYIQKNGGCNHMTCNKQIKRHLYTSQSNESTDYCHLLNIFRHQGYSVHASFLFGLVLLSIGLYKRYLNYKKWRLIQRRLDQQRQERKYNLVVDTTRMTNIQLKIYLDQQELKEIMNRIKVAQNGGPESKIQIYNHREAQESDYHRYALKSISPINQEIQPQLQQQEANININNELVFQDNNYEQDNYTKANEVKFQMYALPPEIRDDPQYLSRCNSQYLTWI